jgi:Raf kinase inhibitor-like YbhB/YbcL family protein
MSALFLESDAFENGNKIPRKYGYKNNNVSPPLKIKGVSEDTKSLVLIMDDPDAMGAVGKIWVHWIIWNIDPNTTEIRENSIPPGSIEGQNDFGEIGYGGPAPPDKEHTYVFKLYAINTKLNLKEGSTKDQIEKSIQNHIVMESRLEGKYSP